MDYTKFNVEDFASDDSFIDWVNQQDPAAEKFWTQFVSAHPELKVKIDQARTLVLNLRRAVEMPYHDREADALWKKIATRVPAMHSVPAKEKVRPVRRYALASIALLVAALGTWYIFMSRSNDVAGPDAIAFLEEAPADFAEEVNTTDNTIRVHLSDGSVVSLERNSRLKYKTSYEGDSSRHVYLTGDAFFEVARNPYQPFFVHSNEVVTEVIGTSFRVEARQEERNVVVSVKTGKVSVYSLKRSASRGDLEKNGVVLLPNQKVMYRREEQSFDRKLVEAPEIVTPTVKESDFTFDNTPVDDVFKTLENAYGIEIFYNDEIMKDCFVTAPLGSEPLFEKLRIICRTIGASYEIVDAKVIISSPGC